MAKIKLNKYNLSSWILKKNEIDEYLIVNELNRKDVITIGRVLYIISKSGSNYLFRGAMVINPCFTKGWYNYPLMPWQCFDKTHFRVNLDETNKDEWAKSYKSLIDNYIQEKSIFYKKSDPILEFIKE